MFKSFFIVAKIYIKLIDRQLSFLSFAQVFVIFIFFDSSVHWDISYQHSSTHTSFMLK